MQPRSSRVLIVDDDRDTADTMVLVLESAGYHAFAVYSGRRALEIVATFAPEIAIVDVEMPDMDGHATARALREWAAGRPLILIAHSGTIGLGGWYDTERFAHFDHLLAKPVNSKRLLRALRAAPGRAHH